MPGIELPVMTYICAMAPPRPSPFLSVVISLPLFFVRPNETKLGFHLRTSLTFLHLFNAQNVLSDFGGHRDQLTNTSTYLLRVASCEITELRTRAR